MDIAKELRKLDEVEERIRCLVVPDVRLLEAVRVRREELQSRAALLREKESV